MATDVSRGDTAMETGGRGRQSTEEERAVHVELLGGARGDRRDGQLAVDRHCDAFLISDHR